MPAAGGNFPLVYVTQEIFGVHEHIKDLCRRFAKLGYMAVSGELYARQGDVSKLSDYKDILAIVGKVPDAQVIGDIDGAVAWARKNGAHASKLGITGFCWGGRITWMYSAHNPAVGAGVAWYGPLVGQASELKPKNPIDIAATLKVPVLGLYGGADPGITADAVEQMRAALKKAGSASEIIVYPDTPHGFNADYRPSYRKEQAADGWNRLQAWFKKYGVA
jgi:carboxymethylenebutenolidase